MKFKNYLKKPVTIEAMQWNGKYLTLKYLEGEGARVTNSTYNKTDNSVSRLDIKTCTSMNGQRIGVGDYIVRYKNGDFAVFKEEEFKKHFIPKG